MKKFAFAVVFAVVAVAVPLASSCGGGPKCKKLACAPACNATMQFCDTTDYTCKDNKTCSPACKTDGTEFCNPQTGTCAKLCSPACKTDGTETCDFATGMCKAVTGACSPACGAGKVCDNGTCKDTPVCSPVCDATKGEFCTF